MQSDVIEAAVRITEAFLAKDGPTGLSFPAGYTRADPEAQGEHVGKVFTKIWEAVVQATS